MPKSPAWQHREPRWRTGLFSGSLVLQWHFWNAGQSCLALAISNCSLSAPFCCWWRAGGLTTVLWYCISGAREVIQMIATCHNSPEKRHLRGGQGCCALSKSGICSLPGGTYSLSTSVEHWSWLLRGSQVQRNYIFPRRSMSKEKIEARSTDSHIYHPKIQFMLSFLSIKPCNGPWFFPVHTFKFHITATTMVGKSQQATDISRTPVGSTPHLLPSRARVRTEARRVEAWGRDTVETPGTCQPRKGTHLLTGNPTVRKARDKHSRQSHLSHNPPYWTMRFPSHLLGKQEGRWKMQALLLLLSATSTSSFISPVHLVGWNLSAPFLPGTGTWI